MIVRRRTLLPLLALPLAARAQGRWPDRPVRIIVPFAPGGTTDIVARILATHLQERLFQPFVVENRPGAGGTLAAAQVAQATPDGTTLLISNSASNGISPSLFQSIRYDALADFEHIALAATTSNVLTVNPAFEARSVAELVALAKARTDGLDYAHSGNGTTTHLLGLRFAIAAGIRLNPVAYRGSGPAITDLVAGNIRIMFDGLPSSIGHLRGGTLRALAVADPDPNAMLPGVATFKEAGFPDLISYSWFGVSAPRGTPSEIVGALNREIRAILALPAVRARYADLTADAPDTTAEAYRTFIAEELRTWARVVRATGATAG
jgi:tripartite-type tricarboxylate transporter receptor subunit TctC